MVDTRIAVRAFRWTGSIYDRMPRWVAKAYEAGQINEHDFNGKRGDLEVHPLKGTRQRTKLVHPGDWLIRGSQGELYKCTNEMFQRNYKVTR